MAGEDSQTSGPGEQESVVETTSTIQIPTTNEPADGRPGELSHEDATALEALPSGSALLLVRRGPSAGSRFLLDSDETSVGRHPDSDIFLDDVTVSRRHAVFRRAADGFGVSDIGSLNGTYVNRDRIDDVQLTGGDEVQIGKFRLVFFPSPADVAGSGT